MVHLHTLPLGETENFHDLKARLIWLKASSRNYETFRLTLDLGLGSMLKA